jgi:hypothetical protein
LGGERRNKRVDVQIHSSRVISAWCCARTVVLFGHRSSAAGRVRCLFPNIELWPVKCITKGVAAFAAELCAVPGFSLFRPRSLFCWLRPQGWKRNSKRLRRHSIHRSSILSSSIHLSSILSSSIHRKHRIRARRLRTTPPIGTGPRTPSVEWDGSASYKAK